MLTEDEIFLAIDNVPITQNYVVGVTRAIERAVLAKLPKAEILRAAAYLASNNDADGEMTGAEADRIAAVLRELAAGAADARIPEQKGESAQGYVQPVAGAVPPGVPASHEVSSKGRA